MAQIGVVDFVVSEERASRLRIAALLNKAIFGSLVLLLVISPIPYGTAEPWWKAAFVCAVFAICFFAILESLLSGETRVGGDRGLLFSMLALSAFAFLQTLTIGRANPDPTVSALGPWNAISADPYQTRFFVLQLLALMTCLALAYRYSKTQIRLDILFHAVLGIAVASAIFGILRQTIQHQPGFVLPRTMPGQGYGQYINKNHFAYLMEMAFGLGIGRALATGFRRDRVVVYVALLLPIWMGLVLSNSRGGILAMMAHVGVASILLTSGRSRQEVPQWFHSKAIRLVLIGFLVLVIFGGAIWTGGDRLVSTFSAASTEFNPEANGSRQGATRNEIWRATLKMFSAHPIVGVGLGGYWAAITEFHDASGTSTPQEAHNDYLELLSSGGLVGLAIGVWFVVALFRKMAVNLASRDRFQSALCVSALLGIAGVAVHSMVDFGLHLLGNAFVFVILLMFATNRVVAERKSEN